jgi:hypothetical protein
MFITIPASPFVDDVSTLTAAVLNVWRINLGKALDMVGGSEGVASTPATIIEIAGKGMLLSAQSPETALAIAAGSFCGMNGEWDATGGNSIFGQTHITDLLDCAVTGPFVFQGDDAVISWRDDTATIINSATPVTIGPTVDFFKVPDAHSNDIEVRMRISGPVPPDNALVTITRKLDSVSGRVARIKDSTGAATYATIAAGAGGWVDMLFQAGVWTPVRWGGATTVP